MQSVYGRQGKLLVQEKTENVNCIPVVVESKENDGAALCAGDNVNNKNCGVASEDDLLKYIIKVNNSTEKKDVCDLEKEKILFDKFLKEVGSFKPEIKPWSGLQHYIYFIYRHFLSLRPLNATEIYPSVFTNKIRELVEFLYQEDRTQLFLRLLALLREFAYVGKECFKNSNVTKISTILMNLMAYYSAFCSAAGKLSPLVSEFDVLLMDRFQVNWLCLNKSIFYHYIYLDPCVQSKLPAFAKLQNENKSFHKNLIESYECFKEDMALLATHWNKIRMYISILSKRNALENPEVKLLRDYATHQEQLKILRSNCWIYRSEKLKKIQDQNELDAHILALVGSIGQMSDAIIDKIGHCVCDDCLSEEFTKVIYDLEPDTDHNIRRITCYICRDIIPLEMFVSHIVSKHQQSPPLKKIQERKIKSVRRSATKSEKTKEEGDNIDDDNIDFARDCKDNVHLVKYNGHEGASNHQKQQQEGFCSMKEFDKQAERLFSEYLRKRAGLTQNQVIEVCRKEAERIAKRKAAEKKEKERMCSEKKENNVESPKEERKDKKIQLESIEQKIAAIAAHRKAQRAAAVVVAAFFADKKSNGKNVTEGKDSEKKQVEKRPAEGIATSNGVINKEKPREELLIKSVEKKEQVPNNNNAKIEGLLQISNPKRKETVAITPVVRQNMVTSTSRSLSSSSLQCNGFANKLQSHHNSSCSSPKGGGGEVSVEGSSNCCSHHKEVLKKCDCPYCEILGSKTSETRDRLRTRLHQRKERDFKTSATMDKTNNNHGMNISGADENSWSQIEMLHQNETSTNNNVNADLKMVNSRVPAIPDHLLNSNKPTTNTTVNVNLSSRSICTHKKPSRHQKAPSLVNSNANTVSKLPNTSTNNNSNNSNSGGDFSQTSSSAALSTSDLLNTNKRNVPEHQSIITESTSSLSTGSLNSLRDNGDSRDINELLNFIEGNKKKDKIALAEKKAAKKARQKQRKEEERKRIELEAKREEERLKEEKRKQLKLKEEKKRQEREALALAARSSSKLSRKNDIKLILQPVELGNCTRKKDKKRKDNKKESREIEETIPAMVTIKRMPEDNSTTPTVTITLKGSTPDQDRLLYTLVNGQTKETFSTKASIKTEKNSGKRNNNYSSANNSNNSSNSNNNNNKSAMKIKPGESGGGGGKKGEKKKVGKENKKEVPPQSQQQQDKKVTTNKKELKLTLSFGRKEDISLAPVNSEENNSSKKNKMSKKKSKNKNDLKKTEQSDSIPDSSNKQSRKDEGLSRNGNEEGENIYMNSNMNLQMLRLPPGITITKIDGPAINRNYTSFNNTKGPVTVAGTSSKYPCDSNSTVGGNNNKYSTVSGNNNKSGVIVVDTEKLIQQSLNAVNEKKKVKNKKKKNKKTVANGNGNGNVFSSRSPSVSIQSGPGSGFSSIDARSSMVTLKNPIFHSLQTAFGNSNNSNNSNSNNSNNSKNEKLELELHGFPCNQQASIIKNENGMVTIRSPRLQQYEGGTCISSILSDFKPVLESDAAPVPSCSSWNLNNNNNDNKSPFNAQAILSGLPGIEITKIDKSSIRSDEEVRKSNNSQMADVSIIPTGNKNTNANGNYSSLSDKLLLHQDKGDWYENVFTPRENLEEDMDAAERDIEAFKRFCHQTVVPERKEKVAHLNVQDIVFKKKSDLSFFT